MNTLQAIDYLVRDPNKVKQFYDEWVGEGMWTAVCEVMKDQSKSWTEGELDALIRKVLGWGITPRDTAQNN